MPGIYTTQPKVHRSAVTAIDASDPADTSGAIDTKSYSECRFDLTIAGVNFQSLEVQALFWNPRQSLWMGGGKRTFTGVGQHALAVESRGGTIFLKVTAFSGTSFNLSADYVLS
jgi:hypothetical protein